MLWSKRNQIHSTDCATRKCSGPGKPQHRNYCLASAYSICIRGHFCQAEIFCWHFCQAAHREHASHYHVTNLWHQAREHAENTPFNQSLNFLGHDYSVITHLDYSWGEAGRVLWWVKCLYLYQMDWLVWVQNMWQKNVQRYLHKYICKYLLQLKLTWNAMWEWGHNPKPALRRCSVLALEQYCHNCGIRVCWRCAGGVTGWREVGSVGRPAWR